ncbi:MAG TPA: Gfo/Idh/MocA family oxidoreductase [Intrasporangium sp.]|uniref:Gfo/Idh/MocA family protein n=1 Tax=Intrasporangium sp. TaxID=1925024 RepID=UPI002D769A26|nr:Gfo/Idh/MocA family oxidoreductase [Intrasporangium sp.]HET7399385.1 Gfo/Idh/MocA family oxidoreductase [Intrasporangium sp.]
MTQSSIGVAVIGAGMAGRAHCAGYRSAPTLFDPPLPPIRYAAVVDANEGVAKDAATRYGFERTSTDWRELLDADDVDVVSVVVANELHRPIVEELLAAGKHVLCEKPLAPSMADAEAMIAAAQARPDLVTGTGFVYRRQPAVAAVRELVRSQLGEVSHFNGRYWCDYARSAETPMAWRYKGAPGTGALADIGSHLIDLAEFVCGPMVSVSGAAFTTKVTERAVPLGTTYGHAKAQLSDVREPVENDDVATFTAHFQSGAVGTFSISRIAPGHANSLAFDLMAENGAAKWDMDRPAEFSVIFNDGPEGRAAYNGYNQVLLGPAHPYIKGGLPMDFPGCSFGVGDLFGYQARAFLEQVAGIDGLPPVATFEDGLRDLTVIDAVARSAAAGGAAVDLA